jgi:hypothetical protein
MNHDPKTTPDPAPVSPPETVTATLTFPTRDAAETFATQWSRTTRRGHTLTRNCEVILHDVTPAEKLWIDAYVAAANPPPVSPNQLTPESQEALRLALVNATPGQLVKWRPVFTETKIPTPGKP